MKTVLLTGGIGSGKSAVARILQERGVPVYDCDSRAKSLYDDALTSRLEARLGCVLRDETGRFSPRLLAARIFSDLQALAGVEAEVHPALLEDFRQWRSRQGDVPYVVMESAIAWDKPLFDGVYDAIVLVTAPREVRLRRAMRRDGATRDEILRRMDAQRDLARRADAVICNDADLKTLAERTAIAFNLLSL